MMIAGMASAFSGIQAGGQMLSAGSHNIANSQTEGFKRTRVLTEESSAGGGVTVTLQTDERPGPQFPTGEGSVSLQEGSNVNLSEEIISNLQAAHLIQANISGMTIQNQILGTLLDITE